MGTPKLSAEGAKFEAPKSPISSAEGAERGGSGEWGGVSPPQPTRHRRSQGVQLVHLHPHGGENKFFSSLIYRKNV